MQLYREARPTQTPKGDQSLADQPENLQTFKGAQNKDEHGGEAPLGDPGVSAWRPPDLGGQLANSDRSPRCADLEVLSVTDVARIFGRTERTIRNWVRAGHLQRSGFGRSVFFTRAAIEALLQSAPRGEDDQSTSK